MMGLEWLLDFDTKRGVAFTLPPTKIKSETNPREKSQEQYPK
jgi:hypothetical protein